MAIYETVEKKLSATVQKRTGNTWALGQGNEDGGRYVIGMSTSQLRSKLCNSVSFNTFYSTLIGSHEYTDYAKTCHL